MQQQESAGNRQSRAGRLLAWFAIIGLMLGLTAFYHALNTDRGGIIQSYEEAGNTMVILQRDRSGHYLAEGEINGQPVLFLVDTGATDVAISEKRARAMGLEFGPRVAVMTAAGRVGAWRTRLDSVSLGSLKMDNVRATITPGLGNQVLLGMSFLKHYSLRQEGEQLKIESRDQDRN